MMLLVHNPRISLDEIWNWPHTQRTGRKRSRPLQIGSFNKQGDLHTRFILGGHKMSRSPHPPCQNLQVYTEALTRFSHIYCSDGFNNMLLSQGCILEMAPTVGMVGRVYVPRIGEKVRSLWLPGAALGSTRGHVLLMTCSNNEWISLTNVYFFLTLQIHRT